MGFTEAAFNEQTRELVIQFANVSEPLILRYRVLAYRNAALRMGDAEKAAGELTDEVERDAAYARAHAQMIDDTVSEWDMDEPGKAGKHVPLTIERIAKINNLLLIQVINAIFEDIQIAPLREPRSPAGLSLVHAAAN